MAGGGGLRVHRVPAVVAELERLISSVRFHLDSHAQVAGATWAVARRSLEVRLHRLGRILLDPLELSGAGTVWIAPHGRPFILAGSGTLAMDLAGANLIEPGDKALVLSTGVFGDRFAELLSRYGAEVRTISFPLGETIDYERVEAQLEAGGFKVMTATHVDTSTGVRVDPEPFGRLGSEYGVLTILDGVCSVGGEEIRQEEWGIDVVLTASQKAIGVPPGLALLVASERAIAAFKRRKTPVQNYYADWGKWLPIMEAYEERRPSYFGTPPVNHILALDTSLRLILAEGMEARFARHRRLARAFRAGIAALGLSQVPTEESHAAITLTAPRYPDGIDGSRLLTRIRQGGVVLAGGLEQRQRHAHGVVETSGSGPAAEPAGKDVMDHPLDRGLAVGARHGHDGGGQTPPHGRGQVAQGGGGVGHGDDPADEPLQQRPRDLHLLGDHRAGAARGGSIGEEVVPVEPLPAQRHEHLSRPGRPRVRRNAANRHALRRPAPATPHGTSHFLRHQRSHRTLILHRRRSRPPRPAPAAPVRLMKRPVRGEVPRPSPRRQSERDDRRSPGRSRGLCRR